jgi:hypothetical protein
VSKVEGHKGFLQILEEMKELHNKKVQDYGSEKDPFANIRESATGAHIEPWRAAVVRMLDKVHRIERFCEVGGLHNEGVEDSLLDLATYALITLALRREEPSKGQHDKEADNQDVGSSEPPKLPEPQGTGSDTEQGFDPGR